MILSFSLLYIGSYDKQEAVWARNIFKISLAKEAKGTPILWVCPLKHSDNKFFVEAIYADEGSG